jgi:hypothetical protein
MTHPRLTHYPHHADYDRLANEFRPFVMFTHTPHYRSPSVNTDKFGLREHYDADGKFVDLERAAQDYGSCNVLIGGSTAFGVDATDDRRTLAFELNLPGTPCLNLGIRGAVSHQELQAFQVLRRYLPPVKNVVILSGVNLPSLASLDDTVFYPEFGGVFSEQWHYDEFCNQYRRWTQDHRTLRRLSALRHADRWFHETRLGRTVMRYLTSNEPIQAPAELRPRVSFEQKLKSLESQFEADLEIWSAMQSAWGVNVRFVLQPAAGWTAKRLAPVEEKCILADRKAVPSIGIYAHREFYEAYRARVSAACGRAGLEFHDANAWFDREGLASEEIFTDICHLTDRGDEILSNVLKRELSWKESADDRRFRQSA